MEKNNLYREIKRCRLCNASELLPFASFGSVPLGNDLQLTDTLAFKSYKYPLSIYRCTKCSHFQLSVSVNPAKLYANNYTYLTGIGQSFVKHLQSYAVWAYKQLSLSPSSLVVDVGSNDGTCLSFFKELGSKVVGVDPADAPAKIANGKGIHTINDYFTEQVVNQIISHFGHADLVTSHNALAHIDDLRPVFSNINNLLKPGGHLIFEVGYFKSVLENFIFDTTYHEHLDYHHAAPLVNMLISMGFSVIDISTNNVQGGSLRLWFQKLKSPSISPSAQLFLDNERSSILYDLPALNTWTENINKSMAAFGSLVKSYASLSKKIVGYGVPTKATLLLSLAGLDISHIPYFIEDNPLKVNRYLPGLGIPIFPLDKLYQDKPDVIIIFAWNFSEDIIKKLRDTVDWDVVCITPLPSCVEIKL